MWQTNNAAYKFLTVIGLVWLSRHFIYMASLLWLYAKPSTVKRYLHSTGGMPAWALVTGASGGIGKQLANELATLGFHVVLHGRNPEKLRRVQSELSKAHPSRKFHILVLDAERCFDVAHINCWSAGLQNLNITVLINNAGGSTERTVNTLDKLSANRLITDTSVNSMFPTLLLRQTIPLLQRNAPSLVVNISSIADIGPSCTGTYAACRSYLSKLTETIAREMRLTNHDVEVICVRLGSVFGTGQSTASSPSFMVPDASTMAKAILSRVGCGKHTVVGYWRHAIQVEVIKMLPEFLLERKLVTLISGRNPDIQRKI